MFYQRQILFHVGAFHFSLDFLRQGVVTVCMSSKKVFWLYLAIQTRPFYYTFVTKFNMLLNFWGVYILHLLMALHIDGGLDYKQALFSVFFKRQHSRTTNIFIFSWCIFFSDVFCNSTMGMTLCFMSLNFTRLHPQFKFGYNLCACAFNITSLDWSRFPLLKLKEIVERKHPEYNILERLRLGPAMFRFLLNFGSVLSFIGRLIQNCGFILFFFFFFSFD